MLTLVCAHSLYFNSKWDKRTLSSLYLLAISQRTDIRSLRDLRTQHLPLLKTIRDKILALVPEKFPGVAEDEVRMFVHYHPSYCKPSSFRKLFGHWRYIRYVVLIFFLWIFYPPNP